MRLKRTKPGTLGWYAPQDRGYLDKYKLTAETAPSEAQPVILGIPWYEGFDRPYQWNYTGAIMPWSRWWISPKNLGSIRGGHAICALPGTAKDQWNWWKFYNQGKDGACVGFSLSRAVSLMNRKKFDASWLYREAQKIDEWESTPPAEGTSLNAGCEILLKRGHKIVNEEGIKPEDIGQGIASFRWLKSVDEIHQVLKNPDADRLGCIPLLNSWGTDYPRKVWFPDEVIDRIVFQEWGEAVVLSDR